MAVKIIVGLQYGDEGKGRASHYESKNAWMVIRATGGANAGHTVVANGKKYAMHLLPSSIIRPEVISLIGPGVVADIKILAEEITKMREAGVQIEYNNFGISERTHLVFPHHKQLDRLYEMLKREKVGTTGRGIGPAYEEKARRTNLRMYDLLQGKEHLVYKLDENLKVYKFLAEKANEFIKDHNLKEAIFPRICVEEEYQYCLKYIPVIKKFIGDISEEIDATIRRGDIIIEGAQSFYLDNDHGDYPMSTSSNPNASGTASGAGIGPTLVDEVIGVMKAYTSRVGNGPFVTKIENSEVSDKLRKLGGEYGTTTGRPRDVGWLDLVMINHAKNPSGLTSLCVNHLDTIGKFDTIPVCVAYRYKGREIQRVPIDKENCKPVFREFKGGWSTKGATTFEELPKEAQDYINFIEEYVGVPVKYIGVGPDERQTIIKS